MSGRKLEVASLEQHVYEVIKGDILDGRLRPGDSLVEARLAEGFGVSKTPVREALIRLKLDGLVQMQRYRGARVATPSTEDVREICEVRQWIEGGIVASVAAQRPPDIVRELWSSVEAARRALEDQREHEYLETIRDFDAILARGTNNRYAAKIVQDLYNILAFIGAKSLDAPGRREKSVEEHTRIVECIDAGDPEAAAAAILAHIKSVEEDSQLSLSEGKERSVTSEE